METLKSYEHLSLFTVLNLLTNNKALCKLFICLLYLFSVICFILCLKTVLAAGLSPQTLKNVQPNG